MQCSPYQCGLGPEGNLSSPQCSAGCKIRTAKLKTESVESLGTEQSSNCSQEVFGGGGGAFGCLTGKRDSEVQWARRKS